MGRSVCCASYFSVEKLRGQINESPGERKRADAAFAKPEIYRHAFTLTSDDGNLLLIDDKVVVDNGGPHPPMSQSGSIEQTAGPHSFGVQFFEYCGPPSGVDLDLPTGVTYGFAGTVAEADCRRQSMAELIRQFGDLIRAPSALKSSVPVLENAVGAFCAE